MLTLLLFYMHRENIKRLQAGTEGRIGEKYVAIAFALNREFNVMARDKARHDAAKSTLPPRQRLFNEPCGRQCPGIIAKSCDQLHAYRQSTISDSWREG